MCFATRSSRVGVKLGVAVDPHPNPLLFKGRGRTEIAARSVDHRDGRAQPVKMTVPRYYSYRRRSAPALSLPRSQVACGGGWGGGRSRRSRRRVEAARPPASGSPRYRTRIQGAGVWSGPSRCAMYGRRPRCKGKESDGSANRSGAAMYSASECSRSGCGP